MIRRYATPNPLNISRGNVLPFGPTAFTENRVIRNGRLQSRRLCCLHTAPAKFAIPAVICVANIVTWMPHHSAYDFGHSRVIGVSAAKYDL